MKRSINVDGKIYQVETGPRIRQRVRVGTFVVITGSGSEKSLSAFDTLDESFALLSAVQKFQKELKTS